MKFFCIVFLIFGLSLTASSEVDYIEFGRTLRAANKKLQETQKGFSCIFKEYSEDPTCKRIEDIDFSIETYGGDWIHHVMCSTEEVPGIPTRHTITPNKEFELYATRMRTLLAEAPPEHNSWSHLNNYQSAIKKISENIETFSEEARLQETYTNQCVLGKEPTDDSILERVCRR